MQGLDEGGVAGIVRAVLRLNRADQEAVGGVEVTVSVQQVGTGHRGGERGAGVGINQAGPVQQLPDLAQVAGDVRSDVGGLRDPTTANPGLGSQIGGPQEGVHRSHGVAAAQHSAGGLLELAGHLLVWGEGRLGQVPRPTLGVVGRSLGDDPVRP